MRNAIPTLSAKGPYVCIKQKRNIMISINPILSSLIVKSSSKEIAITHGSKSYTYTEIYEDSRRLASYLATLGMKEGDTALIATPSNYELLLIFYASIMLKVQIGIMDPSIKTEIYKAKLEQLSPQWAFIDSKILFIKEYRLLKKLYQNKGINEIHLPQSSQCKTIATGSWMPLIKSHQNIKQFRVHKEMDIDPSFIDYEYIISYLACNHGDTYELVHTLGTIAHSVNYINKLMENITTKTFATNLPHSMLIGISAGLKLEIWKENWTIRKKVKFLEEKKISMISVTLKSYNELIEHCNYNNIMVPQTLERIVIETNLEERKLLDENANKHIHPDTKITVMYNKTNQISFSH